MVEVGVTLIPQRVTIEVVCVQRPAEGAGQTAGLCSYCPKLSVRSLHSPGMRTAVAAYGGAGLGDGTEAVTHLGIQGSRDTVTARL